MGRRWPGELLDGVRSVGTAEAVTTEQIQAVLDETAKIQADLEAAVKAGPEGSLRREALTMATGWLVYVRQSLATALKCEE